MDPLTQGLLGAAVAQLGFRQRIGRSATWMAAGVAMLADVDTFVAKLLKLGGVSTDRFDMLRYHRGLTHSLLAVPVIALIVAVPWWWIRRSKAQKTVQYVAPKPTLGKAAHPEASAVAISLTESKPRRKAESFLLIYTCMLIAALSHPLLDWSTSYGTQLLAPINNVRYALNIMPIIDPAYTVILAVTLLTCWLLRKLSHGAAARPTLVVGWLGFAISLSYIGAGALLHNLAVEEARRLAASSSADSKILRAEAHPYLGTILIWRGVVELQDGWVAAKIRPLNNNDTNPAQIQTARKQQHLLIDKARKLSEVQTYKWFTGGWLRAICRHEPKTHVVEFHDMRYGRNANLLESLWPLRVEFNYLGRITAIRWTRAYRHKRSRWEMIKNAWLEIKQP